MNKELLEEILPKVEKPARYIGSEENSIVKEIDKIEVRFGFAFPDIYEVGMSHLGLHILYNLLNNEDSIYCERVFAPWVDMEEKMKENDIPLYTLETKTPINELDFVGFTLQYEMSYTNILNMLDLGNIPVLSEDRGENDPFIIAGGPCVYNPEPLADIVDFFVIGEGEELTLEVLKTYKQWKKLGKDKKDFLDEVAKLEGIYVPSFYNIEYNEDNTIKGMVPKNSKYPKTIKKVIIKDLDKTYFPDKIIVPYIETVHDRIILEIFRGCTRGCRFCQAGMIYRPVRERKVDTLVELAKKLVDATGHDEISLSSLSTSDYSQLEELIKRLIEEFKDKNVGLSLPSLRLDSFSLEFLDEIQDLRKSGLTFAPEAGSQRLRDVINKGIEEKDLIDSVEEAFGLGWSGVKLYFMIGLPTEEKEDVMGIKDLAYKVKDVFFSLPREKQKGNLQITASTSCFVPKPFTPFQWFPQNSIDEFYDKIRLLKGEIRDRKVKYNYHDPKLSFLEAIIARGDRKVSKAIVEAWKSGCRFDGWADLFDFNKWMKAFETTGIDTDFYATRSRSYDEVLPWDFINTGVTKEFLIKENEKAIKGELTHDCRQGCTACGINQSFNGGVC
ncbi:MAG: TIGR03960 family B12-binding radical SAM protein [Firmicutes bacterium]|nr:TIGR03960 family B12-binding radical SAM protein [Bacillota bacterium]